FTTILLLIGLVCAQAQSPTLVRDLLDGSGDGVQTLNGDFAVAGSKVFFPGTDAGFPVVLCYSDGTTANTRCFNNSNVVAASPELLTPAGAKVFFKAYGAAPSLFSTNDAGTDVVLVKPFTNGLNLEQIIPLNTTSVLLGINNNGPFGIPNELWVSDGTANGTIKLQNRTLRNDFVVTSKYQGRAVMFDGSTNSNPFEPFMSNGTSTGTLDIKVYMAITHPLASVRTAAGAGDLLFVSGQEMVNGGLVNRHVVTNGTTAGTRTIALSGNIKEAIKFAINGYYLFTDNEVGVYDSSSGTYMTLALNVYPFGQRLTNNGKLYYHATDNTIWVTDATFNGTKSLNTTSIGDFNYEPTMIAKNNLLYYTIRVGSSFEMWVKNLTSQSNAKYADLHPGNGLIFTPILANLNQRMVFSKRSDDTGVELWSDSGTSEAGEPVFSTMLISPNPTSGNAILNIQPENLGGNLKIFDATGRLQRQINAIYSSDLNLQGLIPGLYMIQYESGKRTWVSRLIVKE
ncbi:MAG: T9SS type A sorting domain-containing protein, partial [Saprospiraceae bacterium]|nr:T9SS type A sorting domain-containing protein [Saprospiraceae bacterium]